MSDAIPLTRVHVLTRALGIDEKALTLKFATLAHLARAFLVREAKQTLRSTERDYVAGIQPEIVFPRAAAISLVGQLPNMIEWGWHHPEGIDLRDTLLKSPKARTSKAVVTKSGRVVKPGGFKYLIVPFQHSMPRATGRNAPVVGSAYAQAGQPEIGAQLAKDVSRIARKLEPSIASESGRTRGRTNWGGRVSEEDGGPKARERHATGLYTGMARIQSPVGRKMQTRYMTFRVISDDPATFRSSDGHQNWHHKGISPRNLFERTQDYVEQIAGKVFGTGTEG